MPSGVVETFDQLLEIAGTVKGRRVAVACAKNADTFSAVSLAQKRFQTTFALTGDEKTIRQGLEAAAADANACEIMHVPDPNDAARRAVELARDGHADVLLKGSVDTATLMKMALAKENGLRTGRLLSDAFVFEYPERTGNKLIIITDGGLNLSPGLKEKADIVRNAVEVAHALGNPNPAVAILSASEFVNPNLPSSTDAGALVAMNRRGEIAGCVVGGPFALDGAISPESAAEKKLDSPVAGRADILVAPNIETANALAKSTTYFARFRLAHVIVGARIPILITSRADKSDAKVLSIALGLVMSAQRRQL